MFGVFLAQKLANKAYTVVGNGKQTRDFTYVTDVVSAMMSAAYSNNKNFIVNIGSGNTYSVNYLVKLLGGKKTYIPKRPGEPKSTWANIKKAKKLLKWEPKINLKEGVELMLKDISYWKKAPVWNKTSINKATKLWFKYL